MDKTNDKTEPKQFPDPIKSLLLDYTQFDKSSLVYANPTSGTTTRRISIYYRRPTKANKAKAGSSVSASEYSGLQKIIVRTPKMKVPAGAIEVIRKFGSDDNLKIYKSYLMSLSFAMNSLLCNEEEMYVFHQFIDQVDERIAETVPKHLKKWGLPSPLKYPGSLRNSEQTDKEAKSSDVDDYPDQLTLSLPYDKDDGFLFSVYDEDAKKASKDIITKGCYVTAVIELSEIAFFKEKKKVEDKRSGEIVSRETGKIICRPVWNVLQIRKARPYSNAREQFMKGCAIFDETDPADLQQMQAQRYLQQMQLMQIQMMSQMPQMSQVPPAWPPMISGYPQQAIPGYQQQAIPGMPPMPSLPPPPPPKPPADPKYSFKPPTKDELLKQLNKLKKAPELSPVKSESPKIETKPLRKTPENSPTDKKPVRKSAADEEDKKPVKKVVDGKDKKPVKKVVDESDDEEDKKPVKKPVKKVVDESDDEEDKKPVKKPVKKVVDESDDEEDKKPIKKPIKKVVDESDDEEDKKPIKKPVKKVVDESDDEEDKKPVKKPIKKVIDDKKPVKKVDDGKDKKPVKKIVNESNDGEDKKPIKKPVMNVVDESDDEDDKKPIKKPIKKANVNDDKKPVKKIFTKPIKKADVESEDEKPIKKIIKKPIKKPIDESDDSSEDERDKRPVKRPKKYF
jgi:hypothetical protein